MPPCFHGIPTCRALAAAEKVVFLDVGRLKQDLQARVADVKALQGRHTPQARHILRKLLGNEKLRPELIEGDGTKGYRFTGQLNVGRLLRGEAAEVLGTSEREKLAGRRWPRRDSNPCLPSATRSFNSDGQLGHSSRLLAPGD